jgi:hypothetical protein
MLLYVLVGVALPEPTGRLGVVEEMLEDYINGRLLRKRAVLKKRKYIQNNITKTQKEK